MFVRKQAAPIYQKSYYFANFRLKLSLRMLGQENKSLRGYFNRVYSTHVGQK